LGINMFQVLPRRWVVERTFAWIVKCRRLDHDYERPPQTNEAMIKWAMIGLMVRRLEPPPGRKRGSAPRPPPETFPTLCEGFPVSVKGGGSSVMAQLSPTGDGRGGRQSGGFMAVLTEKPPIQLPREKPMFAKLVTKSRGAIVMAGVAASIGLGVA
jgi:hypothetical protein